MSWLRFGPDHRELVTTLAAWLHKTCSEQRDNFQIFIKFSGDAGTTWFVSTVLMAKVSLSEAEGSLGHAQVQHQLAQRALDARRNFSFGMWVDIFPSGAHWLCCMLHAPWVGFYRLQCGKQLASTNYKAEEIACKNYGKEHRETAPALLSLGLAWFGRVLRYTIRISHRSSPDRKNTSQCQALKNHAGKIDCRDVMYVI